MSDLDIQEVLAINRKLQVENEKLKKTNEGVHFISQAFAESRREGEKLKGTIRILTQQLSSASTASLGSNVSCTQTSELLESTISDETLLGLAGQLGTNWRSLAFRLDIQTDEVDQVQEEYDSAQEQIYQILLLWRQKHGSATDVRTKLVSALERTGRRDLAEMLQKSSSETVTIASNCDLPWFVDIVSLEFRGENEWRQLAVEFGLTGDNISAITALPHTERMYGVLDSWLKGLKENVNPIPILVKALIDSGRPDVADKIIEASKARNEYKEEWSMQLQDTTVEVDTPPKSVSAPGDTLHGIPSLNSSIHDAHVPASVKQESIRSFGTRESMGMSSEHESTGPKSVQEEQHTSLSLQLTDIVKCYTTEVGSSELTSALAKMLPKSVEQDKELNQLRTLRHATIDQNKRLKDDVEEKNQTISDLRLESSRLKKELEEMKKVKQDENLRSFEIITKGDAHALRKEELNVEMKQGAAAASDVKPQDNTPVIANLRKENLALKKQIDEILKVNNEWDQHYARMKSSFEAKLKKVEEDKMKVKKDLDRKLSESMERQAADNQKESILDKKQREFDQMLTQAKARIDAVEVEKNEHHERSTRLEKWVHILLTKKTESEEEIGRLNQELENSMQVPPREFEMPRGAPAASYGMQIPRGRDDEVEQRMQEQMDLLQQQNMAFQSDFNQERRDRQQVAGRLAEAEEEVSNLRKIAMDLQEQVNTYETDRRVKRPPGYKSYFIRELPPRGKMIRRGVNYGGNDVYIDGGDVEIDGIDGGPVSTYADSECPMCQRVITDKAELERHVERCTNNFD